MTYPNSPGKPGLGSAHGVEGGGKLLPCPFCGDDCAIIVIDQGDKWGRYEPSCLEVRTGYDTSPDAKWRIEAARLWNTRALPTGGDDA
jgi:hypothetical protein